MSNKTIEGKNKTKKIHKIYAVPVDSPVGTWHVVGTKKGVTTILYPGTSQQKLTQGEPPKALRRAAKQLRQYFKGFRTSFDVALAPAESSEFAARVTSELEKIPYGEIRTYTHIAHALGSPNSARAVAGACATNQYPIIIPCHRVVAARSIGGYAGSPNIKEYLLTLEGFIITD
jgi:methylated-DNA-[protein]-cysteine S-methyltransferase